MVLFVEANLKRIKVNKYLIKVICLRKSTILGLALLVSIAATWGIVLGADLKNPSLIASPDLSKSKLVSLDLTKQEQNYYLVGNLDQARATINTDLGPQQTTFRGEIAFMATSDDKGQLKLELKRLNLISNGVSTKKGNSGVIGLNLDEYDAKTSYDQKTGKISSEFQSVLHYALIDDIKGFVPSKSEEGDVFYSFTEMMAGKFSGNLPESLQLSDKGYISLRGEVKLELDDPVLGLLENMVIYIDLEQLWWHLGFEPAEILLVQPVFIGTGPLDPTATGTAFDTLIDRSLEVWNRCGTERCLAIRSNLPIYVDNDDYRVLDNYDSDPAEANALRAEVNVPEAVEVFVVERWDPLWDGGGASWSSGTASAKVVTCDQQLAVPCPPPVGLWGCSGGFCGDVNYCHLAHELGHSLSLTHPGEVRAGRPEGSTNSIMEPSGFCRDNPNVQSAHNCRMASNPLLYWGRVVCTESPDITD